MSFLETVERARTFLERNGRVSLRALQREFALDDDALEELIEELVGIQRVAARDERALAWVGDVARAPTEPSERERAPRGRGNPRLPYTPKHLADEILRSKSALEGERKQVTVLFADVKGSMALAEQIDPEQWHAILERFFQILTDGVHRFEGTVNQYTGDGVMALFGAPVSHEDHAQRACYAALYLREALREYAEELRRERGVDFLTRIGLNSGEVVVGKIGDDLRMDYTAQGHTVGLAERAQQLAEPGRPCLTEATAALVHGYFQLEDLGEFTVKGVASPVRLYGLEGTGALRTRLDISRARGLSRFVSRKDEMTTLELALNRAQQGDGQVVGVVGQAGVGKSRLCLQFVEQCRAGGIRVLEAHCPAHGQTVPLLPILELLRDAFGIAAEDTDQAAREKIVGPLLLLDRAFDDVLPQVFEFLGVPDPERPAPLMDAGLRGRQLHGFLRRWVETQSEREPSVLLFDDIQWIDEASDAYLAQLVEAASGTRTLLLVNFRPEYHAEWMGRSDYQQLPLSPLVRGAIDELLQELLGRDPTLVGVAELIRERTAGNPFFIEEVVRSLAESGSLSGSRGRYRLVTAIEKLAIPATVQVVLASRIDRLSEREKRVLQTAAVATVVEKRFSDSLLAGAAGLPEAELTAALDRLLSGEFIAEAAIYPEREYVFRHPLTHAVAYGAQLSARRSEIHSELARTLAGIHAEKQGEHAASIAHHWEQAGEALEAARWHGRAADWVGATDQTGGLRHWRKVSSLLADTPETEARALEIEAQRGILWLGGATGASQDELDAAFARGRDLAEESGDLRSLAYLHLVYGANLGLARNDLAGLAKHTREAAELAERVEDEATALAAAVSLALLSWVGGRPHEAMAIAKRALERAPDDPTLGTGLFPFSPSLWLLGFAQCLEGWAGRPAESLAGLERTLRLARSQGSASLQPVLHLWATQQAEFLGDAAAAMAHAQRDLETAEEVATDDYELDGAYYSLGIAHQLEGNSKEAARCLERSIAIAATSSGRSPFELVNALGRLAVAYADLGESDRARETSEAGLALVRERKLPFGVALGLIMHARVLRQTQGSEAREAIESALTEAEALVESTGIESWQPVIHLERAELARLVGNETAHEYELREAHRLFTEMGATAHAERVARELAS